MKTTFEIAIPVLNEERIIEKSVTTIMSYLGSHGMDNWRLAIADNGSTDNTSSIAHELCSCFPDRLRYLRLDQRGVGLAIRHAWSTSESDIVGYMDADLATEIKHLHDVQGLFSQSNVCIVNGSRLLPGSKVIGRSLAREFTSRGLNLIMPVILHNKFSDAMCGFKFFNRILVLDLLKDIPVIPDWFVAAELLVRAEWRGYHIHELPVTWTDDPDSKANIKQLVLQYLRNIKRLRRCRVR